MAPKLGSKFPARRRPVRGTIEERLLARAERDYLTGCLRWTGAKRNGYGAIGVGGRVRSVHCVAHELWVSPIPDGFHVDHVYANGCRHRDCIEPAHLEAVTSGENTRRAAVLITHCPQGHLYDEANTRVNIRCCGRYAGNETRSCRACGREAKVGKGYDASYWREYRAKRKAQREEAA